MFLLDILLRCACDHVVLVNGASTVYPDQGGRLECAHVLRQGQVSVARDQTSRVKRLNQGVCKQAWQQEQVKAQMAIFFETS